MIRRRTGYKDSVDLLSLHYRLAALVTFLTWLEECYLYFDFVYAVVPTQDDGGVTYAKTYNLAEKVIYV